MLISFSYNIKVYPNFLLTCIYIIVVYYNLLFIIHFLIVIVFIWLYFIQYYYLCRMSLKGRLRVQRRKILVLMCQLIAMVG